MSLTLTRVHEYARHRDPVTGELRQELVGFHPYLSLRVGGGPTVFLQDGQAYFEGGECLQGELPDWLTAAMATCTPEALRAVGFGNGTTVHAPMAERSSTVLDELAALSDTELLALLAQVRRGARNGAPPAPEPDDPGIDPTAPDPEQPEPFEEEPAPDHTALLPTIPEAPYRAGLRPRR